MTAIIWPGMKTFYFFVDATVFTALMKKGKMAIIMRIIEINIYFRRFEYGACKNNCGAVVAAVTVGL